MKDLKSVAEAYVKMKMGDVVNESKEIDSKKAVKETIKKGKIEVIETGRNGALTTYRVTNAAHLADDFYTDMARIDGNDLTGSASKADIRKIRNWAARHNASANVERSVRQTAASRVLVPAKKYSVGDTISGRRITGLGTDFYPNVDQFSLAGLSPDYTGTVQYAYFK